jgi:uncharacterized protein (DUF362 family)
MILNSVLIQRFANDAEIEPSIREAWQGLALTGDIRPDTRVSIKPNYTYPWYKPGVTTSPAVLEATVRVLRDYTAHIRIVESDGGSNAWTAEQVFAGHGVPELCQKYGVTAVSLSQHPSKLFRTVVAGEEIEMELPALLVEETDFFITMPVPKVHAMTGLSLGFKNQWGCIPDVKRLKHHPQFSRKIIAINKILRTRLAIFDGTYFLDRSGPMEGDAVRRDLLIIGEVGAATRVCCDLMMVDPRTVRHLQVAMREGMMPAMLEKVALNCNIAELRHPFHLHRSALNWLTLGVFHNQFATNLLYNSGFAAPMHKLLYILRGRPKDFAPKW